MNMTAALRAALTSLEDLVVRDAYAHCDTEDGPAVTDGRRALETGNVNHALKWVFPGDMDEVRIAFDQAIRDRVAGGVAQELADRTFLETLVRVHRAGEGEGFDGIKPSGTALPPQVVAADAALAQGTMDPLVGVVDEDRSAELEERFHRAVALQDYDVDDLVAARAYVEAYVSYVKWAEGEDHDHEHGHAEHGHAQHGGAGQSHAHQRGEALHGNVHHHGDVQPGDVLHGDVHHHGGSDHR